jgi:long-subunit acyl-CoA synthetase (AMP-forming)
MMFLADSGQRITNVELDMCARASAGTLQAVTERGSWVVPLPEQLISAAPANAGPGLAAARWIGVDTVAQPDAEQWCDPQTGPGDVAFPRYTSGSTCEPHGVVLARGNLLHDLAVIAKCFQASETSSVCSWLPP